MRDVFAGIALGAGFLLIAVIVARWMGNAELDTDGLSTRFLIALGVWAVLRELRK